MMYNISFYDHYLWIYTEITEGINLQQHLIDVNYALKQVEAIIEEEDTDPLPMDFWKQIEEELNFLKSEIMKKIIF